MSYASQRDANRSLLAKIHNGGNGGAFSIRTLRLAGMWPPQGENGHKPVFWATIEAMNALPAVRVLAVEPHYDGQGGQLGYLIISFEVGGIRGIVYAIPPDGWRPERTGVFVQIPEEGRGRELARHLIGRWIETLSPAEIQTCSSCIH